MKKTKGGRVVTRLSTITLIAALAALVWGCAASQRDAGKQLNPADPANPRLQAQITADVVIPKPTEPCLEQHGFAIMYFRAIRDEYDRVSVLGEIKNVGSGAKGVELQASLRDAGGRVVAVGHFCPASNKNIQPDEVWPFTYSFGKQQGAAQAELRIVGAFRTMDILNIASTTP
ncbi:MAG: hypothetical protein A2Y76_08230 [Planctomycetes bacterium RBG_13_60_9]|nr:MAG: hypothetical protein A2Y76_08230 [Planctomycetes bacterium RBG_13_60_9]